MDHVVTARNTPYESTVRRSASLRVIAWVGAYKGVEKRRHTMPVTFTKTDRVVEAVPERRHPEALQVAPSLVV